MAKPMEATAHRPLRPLADVAWLVMMAAVLFGPQLLPLKDPGDFVIRNTVRVSLLYLYFAAGMMIERHPLARHFYTLAWAAYVIHVAMAFEHYHHWKHESAFRHVEEVSGFGPGIFASYVFTLMWTVDVVWWLIMPASHARRPRWLRWGWSTFLAFIVFNGTVVYETGAIRWMGAAGFAVLALWYSIKAFATAYTKRHGEDTERT